jgi:hypothetical protein
MCRLHSSSSSNPNTVDSGALQLHAVNSRVDVVAKNVESRSKVTAENPTVIVLLDTTLQCFNKRLSKRRETKRTWNALLGDVVCYALFFVIIKILGRFLHRFIFFIQRIKRIRRTNLIVPNMSLEKRFNSLHVDSFNNPTPAISIVPFS